MAFLGDIGTKPFIFKALRKFKRIYGQFGVFDVLTAGGFDVQRDFVLFFQQIIPLSTEKVAIDFLCQSHIQQFGQLVFQPCLLVSQFRLPGFLVFMTPLGTGSQDFADPGTLGFVFDPKHGKHGQHLPVQVGFTQADAWVPIGFVSRTPIVAVFPRSAFGLFCFDFHHDRPTAVTAGNHAGSIDGCMGIVGFIAKQDLHTTECRQINQRFMAA